MPYRNTSLFIFEFSNHNQPFSKKRNKKFKIVLDIETNSTANKQKDH